MNRREELGLYIGSKVEYTYYGTKRLCCGCVRSKESRDRSYSMRKKIYGDERESKGQGLLNRNRKRRRYGELIETDTEREGRGDYILSTDYEGPRGTPRLTSCWGSAYWGIRIRSKFRMQSVSKVR